MDRIDIWVYVTPIAYEKLNEQVTETESPQIQEAVTKARAIQTERFKTEKNILTNSDMSFKRILLLYAHLAKDAELLLMQSAEKLELSARAYHRIIKLARTIVDIRLGRKKYIEIPHILEALQYRPKI